MSEIEERQTGPAPQEGQDAPSPAATEGHEACLEAAERLEEVLLHARADLANERRRRDATIAKAVKRERAKILTDVLGIVDNLERALTQDAATVEALLTGVAAVRQQADHVLAENGVTRLEAEGESFDPQLHEAVGIDESGEAGVVSSEVSPGYLIDDEILRVARVLVGRTESS